MTKYNVSLEFEIEVETDTKLNAKLVLWNKIKDMIESDMKEMDKHTFVQEMKDGR